MVEETEKKELKHLPINQETLDIIVANVIPTSKYFEVRFDHLEDRVDRMQGEIKDFRGDVDKRFERMDRRFDETRSETNQRFEGMDHRFDEARNETNQRFDEIRNETNQRFEQVDKRFEQVDKRFEQVIASIDRLSGKLDNRDQEHRSFTLRMFTISIMISFLGVLGMFLKMFKIV